MCVEGLEWVLKALLGRLSRASDVLEWAGMDIKGLGC